LEDDQLLLVLFLLAFLEFFLLSFQLFYQFFGLLSGLFLLYFLFLALEVDVLSGFTFDDCNLLVNLLQLLKDGPLLAFDNLQVALVLLGVLHLLRDCS
jgi:hypothetical protein